MNWLFGVQLISNFIKSSGCLANWVNKKSFTWFLFKRDIIYIWIVTLILVCFKSRIFLIFLIMGLLANLLSPFSLFYSFYLLEHWVGILVICYASASCTMSLQQTQNGWGLWQCIGDDQTIHKLNDLLQNGEYDNQVQINFFCFFVFVFQVSRLQQFKKLLSPYFVSFALLSTILYTFRHTIVCHK